MMFLNILIILYYGRTIVRSRFCWNWKVFLLATCSVWRQSSLYQATRSHLCTLLRQILILNCFNCLVIVSWCLIINV